MFIPISIDKKIQLIRWPLLQLSKLEFLRFPFAGGFSSGLIKRAHHRAFQVGVQVGTVDSAKDAI
jgi:hypothetical protein